ncbi:hypothetical protein GWK47_007827 [Chionoecetes opilio]|uniref:Uncharacterized protein n=1 Tax=Chionoecetes opilio TaxID=41210 RepID=A0A8J4XZV4_CHIOP|nr:hypothetical protein GWK47_007827 [Chionoecetes opilio]
MRRRRRQRGAPPANHPGDTVAPPNAGKRWPNSGPSTRQPARGRPGATIHRPTHHHTLRHHCRRCHGCHPVHAPRLVGRSGRHQTSPPPPAYLKKKRGEAGVRLLTALTALCSHAISGHIPDHARKRILRAPAS